MRIGILLPSVYTSQNYGEGMIFAPLGAAIDLANGLVKNGHQVFFYSSSDVLTTAKIVPGNSVLLNKTLVYEKVKIKDDALKPSKMLNIIKRDFENELTMRAYKDAAEGKLDIIHSYHDFSAHYLNEVTNFPTVYTLHDTLPQKENSIEYERLKLFSHHKYVSISLNQRKSILQLQFIANIYHGLDLDKYPFSEKGEGQLVSLGRLIPEKGVGIAIQTALSCGIRLSIASSTVAVNRDEDYMKEQIEPYVNGETILLQGFLNQPQKAAFLATGKALIFPMQWEEPFGLTMIEAMACGTPVIAYARGSAPELIRDGVTGFLVNSSEEDIRGEYVVKKTGVAGLKEAVERMNSMSEEEYTQMRVASRKHVEDNFTVEKMVENYEALYKSILEK
jgi:glycosyltransferase involved in cell wall biosynthesis